jgi:hypothetical protein
MIDIDKIDDALVQTDPFPHIEVDDVFTEIFFEKMIRNLPNKTGMPTSGEFSYQLDIAVDPGVKRNLDGKFDYRTWVKGFQRPLWDDLHKDLCTSPFMDTILDKFGIDEAHFPVGRYAIEEKGAGLGPHTDRADKILSCVFYIDDNPDAAGTHLLRPKDPNFVPDSRHYSYEPFDIVKTLEYKMNKMIAWPVTPQSFHAYYQDKDTNRRTIKYALHRPEREDAVQERIEVTKVFADDWRKDV